MKSRVSTSLRSLVLLCLAACGEAPGGRTQGNDAAAPGDAAAHDASAQTDGSVLPSSGMWLRTAQNHILLPNGDRFRGRGANLPDTRGCGACLWTQPSPTEVNRRIDALVDDWHANFIRLLMDKYDVIDGQGGVIHGGGNALEDTTYVAHLKAIVRHARSKGVYVLLSLWNDPAISDMGWPTADTRAVWEHIAEEFADEDNVLYGLVNEPEQNYDHALDDEVWALMNDHVAAIRAVEARLGKPQHIIAVQGTGGWARFLEYYVDHPITAGGGTNIAYETHAYDVASDFDARFVGPSATLPVIIGEFGPSGTTMTLADCETLVTRAEDSDIPYLSWAFHQRCPPNLIVEQPGAGGCGIGMTLDPTPWGTAFKARLARAWGLDP